MSSDAAMLSDDDMPLVPKKGHDSHLSINGNGHINGTGDQDTSMSEDDKDDMPSVRSVLLLRVAYTIIMNNCHSVTGNYV
jgi:hypothetical protein